MRMEAPFGRRKRAEPEREPTSEPLAELMRLVGAGQVVPVVDRRFPLAEVAAAVRYQSSEAARGKIIITI